ncbi:aminopeptidase N isoform X1 [Pantherophis guttatus]|uniref:Aminopeptidase N isoform X1 n=2 Tax=Pantherophis guttatus TaxID=94885 RepID=A0A6P9D862_PANGU|nr:aminopeptidase N isoform X1 [Pantherophis guttatus]XP_034291428.1 aminopeptidase N isoform X1 [Pantherophis guttatus]XP_034291429.1 aminopeptidase N isoform X1 [Pantherophis guttatus]XP_060550709.1 aminopeptidase N isoform X1 [Pantherophis guttatus]
MAKGFFISKSLGIVGIVLGLGAVATIIALSVVYTQEKQRADNALANQGPSSTITAGATIAGTVQATTAGATRATTASTTRATTASTTRATTAGANSTITTKPLEPWDHMRLPKTLMPTFYTISLQPFLKEVSPDFYIFKGNSTVEFQCKQPTDLILIHSKKLNYTLQETFLASLTGINVVAPAIERTWLVEKTEYLVVKLKEKLQQDKAYRLHAEFTGELADDLAGFYRSAYMEEGKSKLVATTQMQAADARKAFPCFDEPAMKANFSITLIHLPAYKALSNMPINKTEEVAMSDGSIWTRTEFEPTLKMSTYLLAFIVSEFENVSAIQHNTLIQIWGRPKSIKEGQGDYALNVSWPILSFFEQQYNVPYPLKRLDQVALPDFNAGAMENWGLITYRESALLFDPEFSSIGNKERIVTVIAHEVAHQWFGNLVTLEWWNELWLNEGFASYVEYLGANEAEPTWNIKDLIVPNDVYRVMAIDALASSHPLSSPAEEINTPAQISEVFDSISYSKGASVIRMLSEFLTEPVFREGLQSYFETYQYENTVCDDLWKQLQLVVNKKNMSLPDTVKTIMDRWTLQMGFPVLTVNTTTGIITQKHFLLDPESPVERPSQFNYTWIVPVSWLSKGKEAEMYWLTDTSAENANFSTSANPAQWLLLNINVVGYFRVNYDLENWERLMNQLNDDLQKIPVLNRAQIIDDAFNLARAKHVGSDLALNTTRYLAKEREYLPWDTALDNLDYFRLMFDRSEVYGPMQKYIQKQVTPLFDHFKKITLNWTQIPDGLMDQYNQILAIRTACSYGIPECNELASSWFKAWKANPSINRIPPNLRSAIYCSAIRTGGVEAWDFAWQMFQQAQVISEADKLRGALTCSQTPWILQRYLQYTLDSTLIRRQDATSTINSIASNVVGQPLAWDFVRMNWRTLFQQFGGSSFSFSSLIQSVTQRFASPFELQQLEQFKADNADVGFGSATRALEQALERTKANIKWVAENQPLVLQWFKENS